MIYLLFQYLESIGIDFPGMGLMNYLSFRAMMAAGTAILVALVAGKKIIALLQRCRSGKRCATWAWKDRSRRKAPPPWAVSSSS